MIILSTKPIVQKLLIKPGEKILFINPPDGYFDIIGEIPKDVQVVDELEEDLDFIQVFVKNKSELEKHLPKVKDYVKQKGKLWISYYKLTSKHASDINRDKINEYAQSLGLKGIFMISIDENWSGLRLKKLE
ncbi:MAG: DUF3052 family protein [Asgard group archaeon]|nr:DUF3052 family protein [Asgard group archaeon]